MSAFNRFVRGVNNEQNGQNPLNLPPINVGGLLPQFPQPIPPNMAFLLMRLNTINNVIQLRRSSGESPPEIGAPAVARPRVPGNQPGPSVPAPSSVPAPVSGSQVPAPVPPAPFSIQALNLDPSPPNHVPTTSSAPVSASTSRVTQTSPANTVEAASQTKLTRSKNDLCGDCYYKKQLMTPEEENQEAIRKNSELRFSQFDQEKEKWAEEKREMESKAQTMGEDLATTKKERDERKEQVNDLEKGKKSLEEKVAALEKEMKRMKQNHEDELKAEREAKHNIEKERDGLQQEVRRLEGEATALKNRLKDKDGELAAQDTRHKSELKETTNEVEIMRKEKEGQMVLMNGLENRIVELEEANRQLITQRDQTAAHHQTQMEGKDEEIKKVKEEAALEEARLTNEMNRNTEQCQELLEKYSQNQKEEEAVRKEHEEEREAVMEDLREKNRRLEKEKADLATKVGRSDQEVAALKGEVKRLQDAAETRKKDLTTAQNQVDSLRQENKNLRRDTERKINKLNEIVCAKDKKLANQETELTRLSREDQRQKIEMNAMKEKIETMEAQAEKFKLFGEQHKNLVASLESCFPSTSSAGAPKDDKDDQEEPAKKKRKRE